MEEKLLQLLEQSGLFAILVSLMINTLVSIIGVLPSVFVTATNLVFFGVFNGLLISIIGESLGAVISFILYRKGINKWKRPFVLHPKLLKLKELEGSDAFWIIVSLRILPFMSSGLVTFTSAFSKVSLGTFALASTIGKIPALIFEAGAVYGFLQVNLIGKIVISILLMSIIILIWKVKK